MTYCLALLNSDCIISSRSARAMQYVKGHLLLGLERLRRLDIAILGADNLAGAGDTLDDVNDVYCVLHLLGREIGRTSVQKDTLNPVWNNAIFSAVLPPAANGTSATASGNSAVHVEVFDMDAGGDECIGVVDVPLELLMIDAREPVELELQQGPQVRRQLSGTLTMAWRGVRPPRNPRADGEEFGGRCKEASRKEALEAGRQGSNVGKLRDGERGLAGKRTGHEGCAAAQV